MPPMLSPGGFAALCCLLAAAAALAGCGGGPDSPTNASSAPVESRPAPARSEFPGASGRTLAEVLEEASGHSELVISPAAEVFYPGQNRYPFGVFERNRTQVPDAEVALYLARVPGKKGGVSEAKAGKRALEEPALGPFPAAIESLQTKPAFRARTTTGDPDAALAVYTTHLDFPRKGDWRIVALVREGRELRTAHLASALVGAYRKVPRIDQEAPLIHTPTAASVNGDLSKITTRVPPDTQNEVDFAEALGKKPIVLLFATPQFCQSRVCGPVVDVAEQVKRRYGKKIDFIHMEIYNDNDPNKGARPQVRAFHLPSEPWLFTVGRDGRIENELEGAFGVAELTHVVRKLVSE
jgi:hypothetical protein